MVDFFEKEIEDRRKNPGDDLITEIVQAEKQGQTFSKDEMIMWCWVFLVAGQDTTANLISGGMRALLEFPEQQAKLAADPSLTPGAVEEMLRWVTPTWAMMRTATADTEVGGREIAAGDKLYMFYYAANRDPSIFDDPWSFDVTRKAEHLSFGHGRHFCLGNPLARLEGRLIFEELVKRYPNTEQAGPWVPKLSTTSNFPGKVPVRFLP
jgi:cytochrome P450